MNIRPLRPIVLSGRPGPARRRRRHAGRFAASGPRRTGKGVDCRRGVRRVGVRPRSPGRPADRTRRPAEAGPAPGQGQDRPPQARNGRPGFHLRREDRGTGLRHEARTPDAVVTNTSVGGTGAGYSYQPAQIPYYEIATSTITSSSATPTGGRKSGRSSKRTAARRRKRGRAHDHDHQGRERALRPDRPCRRIRPVRARLPDRRRGDL